MNTAITTNTRPPVVVVLGHVDHGKSSILEAIREDFNITAKESGGITQHIGAYRVEYQNKEIAFIDTPGHEAFSAMRSRGAKVADVALLVVAADEGVKEQTKEAIDQIKKAELPMIVVLNKIDKPEANQDKVKQELSQYDVFVEDFGGKVPLVVTSATTKQGISELLEMILLVSELEDLKADKSKPGEGVIIESYTDTQRGATATLLVRDGTVHRGDVIGTKSTIGKVRILEDAQGVSMEKAVPSTPATVLGFENPPQIGEEFRVFDDEAAARAEVSLEKQTREQVDSDKETQFFNIVLKADVQGSLEALQGMLKAITGDKMVLRIVYAGAGDIGEKDVRLAQGTGARIFGFHVKVDSGIAALADREKVKIEMFSVVYELVQRVDSLMKKAKEPEIVRKDLGKMEVLEIFRTEKNSQIIGGKIVDGEAKKGSKIEIMRGGEMVGKGRAVSLKRGQTDANTVPKGEEGGILYEGSEKVQEGDMLQFYEYETITN
ncbi:translation initiation factor IF-2 [Patescibacteria group bacterium]|nr:translation initiation factor IF-2 [Patescibacteria group bacterium]